MWRRSPSNAQWGRSPKISVGLLGGLGKPHLVVNGAVDVCAPPGRQQTGSDGRTETGWKESYRRQGRDFFNTRGRPRLSRLDITTVDSGNIPFPAAGGSRKSGGESLEWVL